MGIVGGYVGRFVILTIDTITALIYDYAGEALNLPDDIKPIKFRINPTNNGKLELMLESETWEKDQSPEEIKFEIKRVYGL
jgi:hypothetical protein